jgi:hypothetical protein
MSNNINDGSSNIGRGLASIALMHESQQVKPSRKLTVSITLGPVTRKLLADFLVAGQHTMFTSDLTALDQCGGLLTEAIGRAAVNMGVPVPDGWQTHFD